MGYPIPANEAARLAKLHETGILFTGPSDNFDRLCHLASLLFEAPMVLISFVDKHEQWFKAKVGLDVCSTSREVAFCAHTIMSGELLVVTDARNDARFKDNPLVTGAPHIRFYAGAPIVLQPNLRVGTICVLDTKPRHLSHVQLLALRNMAETAATELRLLIAARRLQNSFRAECEHCPVRRSA